MDVAGRAIQEEGSVDVSNLIGKTNDEVAATTEIVAGR